VRQARDLIAEASAAEIPAEGEEQPQA